MYVCKLTYMYIVALYGHSCRIREREQLQYEVTCSICDHAQRLISATPWQLHRDSFSSKANTLGVEAAPLKQRGRLGVLVQPKLLIFFLHSSLFLQSRHIFFVVFFIVSSPSASCTPALQPIAWNLGMTCVQISLPVFFYSKVSPVLCFNGELFY